MPRRVNCASASHTSPASNKARLSMKSRPIAATASVFSDRGISIMATHKSVGKATRWHNWSDSVRGTPQAVYLPRGIDELAQAMGRYSREGRHVRVVGDGHSFTPLAQTDDVLVSLDKMQGVISIDA